MKQHCKCILFCLAFVAASAQTPGIINASDATKILELRASTYHVQGIDTDGVHLWLTSVDTPGRKGYLHEFLLEDARELRRIDLQDGDRFHAGGIAADQDSIWIPVAEYRANSTAVIQKRNTETLALELRFSVPDHIGCLAVTPEYIIGGNWDSRDFYFWDHRGNLIRKLASTTGNAYQDMKFDGSRIVASGNLADHTGAVDFLDYPSLHLTRRIKVGKTDRGAILTREAMTVFKGAIGLLPEDVNSRLFIFPQLH